MFESEDGRPGKVHKQLVPTRNSFVFFKVSPLSFHRVDEIVSDKLRFSLTGWFHADHVSHPEAKQCFRFIKPIEAQKYISEKQLFDEIKINDTYLNKNVIDQMTEIIMENCIIEIDNLFEKE